MTNLPSIEMRATRWYNKARSHATLRHVILCDRSWMTERALVYECKTTGYAFRWIKPVASWLPPHIDWQGYHRPRWEQRVLQDPTVEESRRQIWDHFQRVGGEALQKKNYFPSSFLTVRDPDSDQYLPLGHAIRGLTEHALLMAWFTGRVSYLPPCEPTIKDNFCYHLYHKIRIDQLDPDICRHAIECFPDLLQLCMEPFINSFGILGM